MSKEEIRSKIIKRERILKYLSYVYMSYVVLIIIIGMITMYSYIYDMRFSIMRCKVGGLIPPENIVEYDYGSFLTLYSMTYIMILASTILYDDKLVSIRSTLFMIMVYSVIVALYIAMGSIIGVGDVLVYNMLIMFIGYSVITIFLSVYSWKTMRELNVLIPELIKTNDMSRQ